MTITDEPVGSSTRTVEAAFDEYYQGLVTELTTMCGDRVSASRAAHEAFRRAAAETGFDQIGKPREWLERIARNEVLRRECRSESIESTEPAALRAAWGASQDFRKPRLDSVRAAARRSHRRRLGTLAGAITMALLLFGGAILMGFHLARAASPAQTVGSAPSAQPPSRQGGPDESPPAPRPPEAWTPTADDIINHSEAFVLDTFTMAGGAGPTMTIWKRCAPDEYQPDAAHYCTWGRYALAAEVSDSTGRRFAGLLSPRVTSIVPGPHGTFTVKEVDRWRTWSVDGVGPF
jgi:DNA-directed RNA polymerase specialized sigma24 family protein